jgi:energy-converting hydrogenase Eha subunit H
MLMIRIIVQACEGGIGPFGSVKTESFDSMNSCVCLVRPYFVELLG